MRFNSCCSQPFWAYLGSPQGNYLLGMFVGTDNQTLPDTMRIMKDEHGFSATLVLRFYLENSLC